MLPKVIVHNSISIDGSIENFKVNMRLHYQISSRFKADMHLVGSNTAKIGIETFLKEIPQETENDLKKPIKDGILWAIPDTTGKLNGSLHIFRQSEHCKGVVVLISEKTPKEYISYLKEREYDYYIVGEDKCNLKRMIELLNKKYNAKTILTDTGSLLSNLLIQYGLVSEISLLIHPVIVGKNSYNIFHNVKENLFEKEYVWVLYQV
jgi:2,5-diamino-6-(ribosylamino)-4(3H)-pyrimidinone 5'-phosphate reductase